METLETRRVDPRDARSRFGGGERARRRRDVSRDERGRRGGGRDGRARSFTRARERHIRAHDLRHHRGVLHGWGFHPERLRGRVRQVRLGEASERSGGDGAHPRRLRDARAFVSVPHAVSAPRGRGGVFGSGFRNPKRAGHSARFGRGGGPDERAGLADAAAQARRRCGRWRTKRRGTSRRRRGGRRARADAAAERAARSRR